jgi:hypothetical protein
LSEPEVILTGGNVTPVSRIGDRVHRRSGPWSAGVQRLLGHLEAAGFDRAPRALGFDGAGREVVSFLAGDVYNYPLPSFLWTDALLVQAAELLREYHDATLGFVPAAGDRWQIPAPADLPREVMCHNDVAPYNVVVRGRRLAGLIDFDTAGPGPRVWDVVHAAYRFVPLSVTEGPPALHAVGEQSRRLRLFADTYNLSAPDRDRFVPVLRTRLSALRRTSAADAHVYARDAEHVSAHRAALTGVLRSPAPPGGAGTRRCGRAPGGG